MRKIFFIFLFLISTSFSLWHRHECKNRIKIKIKPFEEEKKVGMILKGYDFYKLTGFSKIDVNSISLWDENEEIPIQIEEMDGTGRLVYNNSNGILDDDDRIVFLLDLKTKEHSLYLYFNGPPIERKKRSNNLNIEEKRSELIPIIVKGEKLIVGIKGGGLEENPSLNRIENYGRGAIPLLIWQDLIFFDFKKAWNNFFPRSIGTGPGKYIWSEPKIVYKGNVRSVFEIKCEDYKEEKDGDEIFKGNITRYISVWNEIPVIDIEEYVIYKSSDLNYKWFYSMEVPAGKKIDENDFFMVTLSDNVYVLNLKNIIERAKKYQEPYQKFYSTDNPEEGWFAIFDKEEKNGIAVFYEKMDTIKIRKEWITYRPPIHPNITLRTNPYERIEINLYFNDRALRTRDEYKRDLRYIFLKDEKPETIRAYYKLWAEKPWEILFVDFPETIN